MAEYYGQNWYDHLARVARYVVIGGALLGAGCGNETVTKEKEEGKPSFSEFGTIAVIRGNVSIRQIQTADLDGDGDQDIIIGDGIGRIRTLENRMNEAKEAQPE